MFRKILKFAEKKYSTRLSGILEACQKQNIPVSRVDKGELNNMSGNKPHQVELRFIFNNHHYHRVTYKKF